MAGVNGTTGLHAAVPAAQVSSIGAACAIIQVHQFWAECVTVNHLIMRRAEMDPVQVNNPFFDQ